MEIQTPPNPTSFQTPTPTLESPRQTNWVKIFIFCLSVLGIILFSIYIGIQIGNKQQINNQTATIQPTVPSEIITNSPVKQIISPTTNPTLNWKTYTNPVLKYSISYPNDWSIDTSKAELPVNPENSQELSISKGLYKLHIVWPSVGESSLCLYDDQSRQGAPEMASYCEGEYVEFSGDNGNETYRRLVKPKTYQNKSEWLIYQKEKIYFFMFLATRYYAPADYQSDQIALMDQILATFQSIK